MVNSPGQDPGVIILLIPTKALRFFSQFFNLYFFKLQFTFNIILYSFQVYSTVVTRSQIKKKNLFYGQQRKVLKNQPKIVWQREMTFKTCRG